MSQVAHNNNYGLFSIGFQYRGFEKSQIETFQHKISEFFCKIILNAKKNIMVLCSKFSSNNKYKNISKEIECILSAHEAIKTLYEIEKTNPTPKHDELHDMQRSILHLIEKGEIEELIYILAAIEWAEIKGKNQTESEMDRTIKEVKVTGKVTEEKIRNIYENISRLEENQLKSISSDLHQKFMAMRKEIDGYFHDIKGMSENLSEKESYKENEEALIKSLAKVKSLTQKDFQFQKIS